MGVLLGNADFQVRCRLPCRVIYVRVSILDQNLAISRARVPSTSITASRQIVEELPGSA